MSSLVREAKKLQTRRQEVSKLKRKSAREFEREQSLLRKSSSGLATVERKIESAKEQLSDVSDVLTQKLAQQESIQRLIAAAEERLQYEKEARDQAEQEIEYAASGEEKENAKTRLVSIIDRIDEISEEIKQRNKMAKKVADAIEDFSKSRSKISTKIQKKVHEKPELKKLIKKSKKASARLAKSIASKAKQEESTKEHFKKVKAKLEELKAKRRKSAAKRAAQKRKKKTAKKSKRKSKPKRKSAKKAKRR